MNVIKHDGLGEIFYNEAYECYLLNKVHLPYFKTDVVVKLVQYDEDFEPIDQKIYRSLLDDYARTLTNLLNDMAVVYDDILQALYDNYLDIYARYYEKPFKIIFANSKINLPNDTDLHQPLMINSKEQHFEYIDRIHELQVSNHNTIIIIFRYGLDTEHGLEVKIRDNKVVKVGGIGETLWEE